MGLAKTIVLNKMINLKKLAVGINSIHHLKTIQNIKIKNKEEIFHITRQKPSRKNELVNGGSLYWIIKNKFSVRQLILNIEEILTKEGKKGCKIVLDNHLIDVQRIPHRAFQGWRYMEFKEAPLDISKNKISDLPEELNNHLFEFGFKL